VIERFILTLKNECPRLLLAPYRGEALLRELVLFGDWYNETRPHMTLRGRTPNDVYHAMRRANRSPRFETRARWPRASRCARPRTLVKVSLAFASNSSDLSQAPTALAARGVNARGVKKRGRRSPHPPRCFRALA
jgi:hypothetical protein